MQRQKEIEQEKEEQRKRAQEQREAARKYLSEIFLYKFESLKISCNIN